MSSSATVSDGLLVIAYAKLTFLIGLLKGYGRVLEMWQEKSYVFRLRRFSIEPSRQGSAG